MVQSIAAPNTNADKGSVPKAQISRLDVGKAIASLDQTYPGAVPGHHCARAVRLAIEAGGISLKAPPIAAKDYGPTLQMAGFVKVGPDGYKPEAGDVAVIQPYAGGNPAGHVTLYEGRTWHSDFVQKDMWSGPGYRSQKPPYVVYRP